MSDRPSESQAEKTAQTEEDERIISINEARSDAASEEVSDEETEVSPQPGELEFTEIKTIIEALLFAAEEPLSSSKLAELSGAENGHVARKAVEALEEEYDFRSKPYAVQEIAGGFRILTRPEFDTWVGKLREKEQTDSLSQAALETLAIVAYRQPIMRAEIEDIRGVSSGYILRSLIEKSLIRVTGRSDELGRPLLYGTTKKFLDAFGLSSLDQMPALDDLEDEG
ncbi:MAG: SMC-Scp complex subunit ScpB [Planctomycetota bacterium]